MNILIVFLVATIVWAIITFTRLELFSNLVKSEIERVYSEGVQNRTYEGNWPDVTASYRNLKSWEFWNWNFKGMMRYER